MRDYPLSSGASQLGRAEARSPTDTATEGRLSLFSHLFSLFTIIPWNYGKIEGYVFYDGTGEWLFEHSGFRRRNSGCCAVVSLLLGCNERSAAKLLECG